MRTFGSPITSMAWVAAGHCDASFDRGLNAWDVAAGGLLVREAGGEVSNFLGEPDFLEAKECVAGNAALRAGLVTLLRPFAWRRPHQTVTDPA